MFVLNLGGVPGSGSFEAPGDHGWSVVVTLVGPRQVAEELSTYRGSTVVPLPGRRSAPLSPGDPLLPQG